MISQSECYLLSFFVRVNYSIAQKYLFTLTLEERRYFPLFAGEADGDFPQRLYAFAWNVGHESFLRQSHIVSDLKLRLGYGITGQQDLNNGNDYPYVAKYTISDDAARYAFGNQYYNTLRPDGYDADIRWETTTTANVGVDFGFAGNRITGSLDFYLKETKDLLSIVDVPVGTNFSATVLTNVGSMENRGVEMNLNAKVITTDKVNWEEWVTMFTIIRMKSPNST